jgi:hypothetical protein
MKSFPTTLWQSPAKVPLLSLLTVATGSLVNHLIGQSGKVELPATIATDLLLLVAGLVFAVGGVAYAYWKKCQPMEFVEWSRKQGRPICHCTEIGTVMTVLPKPQSGVSVKLYICPKCEETKLAHQPIVQV